MEREESLSTGGFVKSIIFGKTLVEREEPCPQEDFCEKDHFWKKSLFSKMTHNLVFAGQQYRTATLPHYGQGV